LRPPSFRLETSSEFPSFGGGSADGNGGEVISRGKIFISYRRDDDPGFAHALYLRLEQEFGGESLFMDVEGHIEPGDDFEALNDWGRAMRRAARHHRRRLGWFARTCRELGGIVFGIRTI
jgi:hypothetical protein